MQPVALLAPGRSAGIQKLAAATLGNLCSENVEIKDSVRECGGVPALVGLLAPGGSAAVHTQAARALHNLCADSTQSQERVRECGGAAALVGLLGPGGSAAVHEQAAAALGMCFHDVQNGDSVSDCGGAWRW